MTTTITSPVSGFVNSLGSVQGTASDKIPPMTFASNLSTNSVSLGIQLVGTGWWNGTNFTSGSPVYYTVVNSTAPTPNTWTYAFAGNLPAAIAAASGQSIYLVSRSTDLAKNVEFPANSIPPGTGVTVNLDFDAPASTVTFPLNNGFVNAISSLTGTVGEVGPGLQSGVNSVKIAILQIGIMAGIGMELYFSSNGGNPIWN